MEAWIRFRTGGCREVTLHNWNLRKAAQNHWRFYWNPAGGAEVRHQGRLYPLDADRIVLISPNTHFTSRLRDTAVRHLFAHFQLGKPYDNIEPTVFSVEIDRARGKDLQRLRHGANRPLEPSGILLLGRLIFDALGQMEPECWPRSIGDDRIEAALSLGLTDLSKRRTNDELAQAAHMSTNAFIRRFRQITGQAPQIYLTHRRIELARYLLAQTDGSVEQIAESCGFAGRSHFSTVFAKAVGVGPAGYRKRTQSP
jgi:AraC-like DNA-binding protein